MKNERSSPRTARVCICSTVHQPLNLESWLRYHLAIGIAHIYLYFDRGSADDIELARSFGSRVTVSASLLSGVPVRSMQMLNVRDAIAIARREFDWLLHIDDDELFHVRRGNLDDVFTGVGDAVCQLHFENLEVVRTKDSLARYDYFKDERYFKRRQNGPPFLSYWNGKSAGNLRSSRLRPHGPHYFRCGRFRRSVIMEKRDAVVLHYPFCDFERWITKAQILGDDATRLDWGAYQASRDLLTDAAFTRSEAEAFYRKTFCVPDVRQWESEGRIVEIDEPARIIVDQEARAPRRGNLASAADGSVPEGRRSTRGGIALRLRRFAIALPILAASKMPIRVRNVLRRLRYLVAG